MTSIDDTPHGEQEEEDEWETVWVPGDYLQQEAMRQQQRFSDPHTRALEDLNRIQDQIDPPSLRALRRMDQIAAGSMPTWMENQRRTEEMLYRAQGLVPQRRRRQRAHLPIDQQPPERPSTPPRREDAPPVAPSQTNSEPPKRKRGNPSMRPFLDEGEFDAYMREYVSAMQDLPTQPEFIRYLEEEKHVVLTRWTLGRYAKRYTDWRGCVAHFAHLIRHE